MMKRPLFLHAAALAATLAGASRTAGAGPSVVRDETLTDVGTTPVLGRGYSLATNTLQSICLKEIVKTKPSYDFKYKFEQIDESVAEELKRGGSVSAAFQGGGFGVSVGAKLSAKFAEAKTSTSSTINILVSIDIDTYYASVDETKSELADTAVQLAQKDLPAFFDACGMYYVRSINRNSKVVAIFSFEEKSSSEAKSFAAELEATVSGWGQSGSVSASINQDTARKAASKKLKITTNAFGLGKMEGTTLLAYDLETFRTAVLSAFRATQNEDVGRVTSIEIVPWVEHLQFQSILLGNAAYASDRKRFMVVNSEFLAEVDRAARAKLNTFYKAKQCRGAIQSDYWTFDQTTGSPKWIELPGIGSMANVNAKNFRPGATPARRTFENLWAALAPEKLQTMYNEYDAFMYGGKDDLPIVVQNGRRTYRYGGDNTLVIPPTGDERVAWTKRARANLPADVPMAERTWLVPYAEAYLRAHKQAFNADKDTLTDVIAPLLAEGSTTALAKPFTETLSFLSGTERKTVETPIATRADLEDGIWRFALNNPGAVVETEDGWFGFAAAAMLDNAELSAAWMPRIRAEIKERTGLDLGQPGSGGDAATYKDLGDAYDEQVKQKLKEGETAPFPAFTAVAQGVVARTLQGKKSERSSANNDDVIVAYLLKQLKTQDTAYLEREARRVNTIKFAANASAGGAPKLEPAGKILPAHEWEAAQSLFRQYKRLAGQGGSMNLGSVGFFGSAEYIGAAKCVRDLLVDSRFMKDSYRNIESCMRVENQLGTIRSTVVEDFCLPKPEL
jgi:hypothetical protein